MAHLYPYHPPNIFKTVNEHSILQTVHYLQLRSLLLYRITETHQPRCTIILEWGGTRSKYTYSEIKLIPFTTIISSIVRLHVHSVGTKEPTKQYVKRGRPVKHKSSTIVEKRDKLKKQRMEERRVKWEKYVKEKNENVLHYSRITKGRYR